MSTNHFPGAIDEQEPGSGQSRQREPWPMVSAAFPPRTGLRESEAVQAIAAGYERFFQAFQSKDLETMLSLLTDDFAWELLDGQRLDRPQTRAMLQEQLQTLEPIKASGTILRMDFVDGQAIVLIREKLIGVLQEPDRPFETIAVVEEYRDTWIQEAGFWKIRRGVALSSETTPWASN